MSDMEDSKGTEQKDSTNGVADASGNPSQGEEKSAESNVEKPAEEPNALKVRALGSRLFPAGAVPIMGVWSPKAGGGGIAQATKSVNEEGNGPSSQQPEGEDEAEAQMLRELEEKRKQQKEKAPPPPTHPGFAPVHTAASSGAALALTAKLEAALRAVEGVRKTVVEAREEVRVAKSQTELRDATHIPSIVATNKPLLPPPASQLDWPRPTSKNNVVEKIFFSGWVLVKEADKAKWSRRFVALYKDRLEVLEKLDSKPSPLIELSECAVSGVAVKEEKKEEKKDDKKKDKDKKDDHDTAHSPCSEVTFQKKKWHIAADNADDSTHLLYALKCRLITHEYIRKSKMVNGVVDDRLIAFLELPLARSPVNLILNDKPLSLDTISMVARVISDDNTQCIGAVECRNASLGSMEIEVLGKAVLKRGTSSTSLTRFDLSFNKFGDKDAPDVLRDLLCNCPVADTLILSDCAINDDILAAVASKPAKLGAGSRTPRTLVMTHNNIGEKGVRHLIAVLGPLAHRIERLVLHNNALDDAAAIALSELVAGSKVLLSLDLSYNQIGGPGARELGSAVGGSTSVADIDLTWNPTTQADAALKATSMVAKGLRHLRFGPNYVSAQGLSALRLLTQYGLPNAGV